MKLRPVFINTNGARLYQAGFKRISELDRSEKMAMLSRYEISLVVGASDKQDGDIVKMAPIHHDAAFPDNSGFRAWLPAIWTAVEEAAWHMRKGKNVLVYCFYGVNRSGLLNALIIRELLDTTGAAALEILRLERRGAVGGNDHFEEWLASLPKPRGTLFDLDGTLFVDNVYPPQAVALTDSLDTHWGWEPGTAMNTEVDWVGRTDIELARLISSHHQLKLDVAYWKQSYERRFGIPEYLMDNVRPFARDALLSCLNLGPIKIVTGNTRTVARRKLSAAALWPLFSGGGFAEDGETRYAILESALFKTYALQWLFVGDTWRDIAAGREVGTLTAGLVTPKHDAHELREAHHIIHDLREVAAL